jgi:hypothetical protein
MKLTKRGKRVRAILILAGMALLYWVTGNFWWNESSICIGEMVECFKQ